MPDKPIAGKLFVVATPIGNSADITRRAVDVLSSADAVVCEERKNGARLLKELGIDKPLIELNEHNESNMIQDILVLLMQGQSLALVSDCGTPVFSDPGRQLLVLLNEMNIQVVPVPGASSISIRGFPAAKNRTAPKRHDPPEPFGPAHHPDGHTLSPEQAAA